MNIKGHKRNKHHVVIVTSDAVDAGVKQYKINAWVSRILLIIVCIGLGALIGYLCFAGEINKERVERQKAQKAEIEALELEKAALEQEKNDLNMRILSLEETVQVLSETVNQKTQNEKELAQQLENQLIPTGFPLNSSATMEEGSEEDTPMCIFYGADDAMVIATAKGTVTAINDDAEYGKNLWIDHGNGYVTIYRNAGEVKVKQGETVTQGSTLFLLSNENNKLGYQMMKDGVYINPMEMLSISG